MSALPICPFCMVWSGRDLWVKWIFASRAVRGDRSVWFPLLRAICTVWPALFFCRVLVFFRLIYIAKYVLSSLNISSAGRDKVWNIPWTSWPGPAVWLTVASYTASYHGCHIYLCPASPEIATTFLVESLSYKDVLMFLASRFLSCHFVRSGTLNVNVHTWVHGLFGCCSWYCVVLFSQKLWI